MASGRRQGSVRKASGWRQEGVRWPQDGVRLVSGWRWDGVTMGSGRR